MITRSRGPRPIVEPGARRSSARPPETAPGAWQGQLRDAVRSAGELLNLLGLDPESHPDLRPAAVADFPVLVPRGFVARMRPGDPRDPLLLQVLPRAEELEDRPGYTADPLAEAHASPVPGLLRKYRGRALVVATAVCAVHCRYCFRRSFPYGEHRLTGDAWAAIRRHLAADPSLQEVILSGGDPLSLSDRRLAVLLDDLDGIPHIERLRLHTRLPVVLPERVDDGLLEVLGGSRLSTVVVLHANHAREVDAAVTAACERLRAGGISLLNQSVLLRGINDSSAALEELSRALFRAGVLPYYLHLLDPVRGTAHFAVDDASASALSEELRARLPGYLVPRLVREVPGAPAKLPL